MYERWNTIAPVALAEKSHFGYRCRNSMPVPLCTCASPCASIRLSFRHPIPTCWCADACSTFFDAMRPTSKSVLLFSLLFFHPSDLDDATPIFSLISRLFRQHLRITLHYGPSYFGERSRPFQSKSWHFGRKTLRVTIACTWSRYITNSNRQSAYLYFNASNRVCMTPRE